MPRTRFEDLLRSIELAGRSIVRRSTQCSCGIRLVLACLLCAGARTHSNMDEKTERKWRLSGVPLKPRRKQNQAGSLVGSRSALMDVEIGELRAADLTEYES